MKKSILNLGTVLKKQEQKEIHGGFNNPACKNAISLDGTLCLCKGWYPNGSGHCEFRAI